MKKMRIYREICAGASRDHTPLSFSTDDVSFLGHEMSAGKPPAQYGVWPFRVLSKTGIPGPSLLPFFGTLLNYRKGFMQFDTECFEKYGKVWRLYDGRQPIIAVLDPAVIKAVLVKECYSTFTNRRPFPGPEILQKSLASAQDEQWKRIRTVLSPTFTSGKLKEMFPIIKHYGEILNENVQKKMANDELLDVKEVFGAYSMDVVTSTSFGVDINSMNNPKDPFVKRIQKLTKFKAFDPRIFLPYTTFHCIFIEKEATWHNPETLNAPAKRPFVLADCGLLSKSH